jgi:hypothetical protein
VLASNHLVNGIQSSSVEVPFAALGTNFGVNILDNVEPAPEPVLLPDRLRDRVSAAEFALWPQTT